jgi:glycosyltransferase involved in cell wall biosynthesis
VDAPPGQAADERSAPEPGRSAPRTLRIGVEAHVVGRRQTGNERVVANLVRGLAARGPHHVVVYFTDPATAEAWTAERLPNTTVRLLRPAHPAVRIPFGLPLAARRDRLDVLLAHVNRPPFAPCPVVTLVHDVAFARYPEYFSRYERIYMNRSIPASIRKSRAIVAVSAFTRDEIVALYGVPASRITVAPNGVDRVFLDPTPRRSPVEPPFFLAIGNLQPRKNLVTLIRAYRRFSEDHPDAPERLVIVGQERLGTEDLYREAEDLRRAGRVEFTGYVADEEMVGLLQRATAFAYPSVYEGFGLPPLEAMAAGAPALVADIPVMREVAGEAARRLAPTDPDAWASALWDAATDRAGRPERVARGRAWATGFTWERAASIVGDVLERAATGRT